MGRAPAFWTEENTRLIRDHFVAVSLSNIDQNRKDAVGQFLREAGMQLPGAGGSQWCVTTAGKVLESNNHNGLGFNLKRALEKGKALPEAERAPGAIKVPDLAEVDSQRSAPTPPPGTLILKLHVNDLRLLKRWILFWGPECQVLEPDELIAMILADLKVLGAVYRPPETR